MSAPPSQAPRQIGERFGGIGGLMRALSRAPRAATLLPVSGHAAASMC